MLRRLPWGTRVEVTLEDGSRRLGRVGRKNDHLVTLLDDPNPIPVEHVVDVVMRLRSEPAG